MVFTTKIDGSGRVLVPSKAWRELGLQANEDLIVRVENGELRMHTRKEAIRRARERLKKFKSPGESVVDEFLAERREEARREVQEMDRQ